MKKIIRLICPICLILLFLSGCLAPDRSVIQAIAFQREAIAVYMQDNQKLIDAYHQALTEILEKQLNDAHIQAMNMLTKEVMIDGKKQKIITIEHLATLREKESAKRLEIAKKLAVLHLKGQKAQRNGQIALEIQAKIQKYLTTNKLTGGDAKNMAEELIKIVKEWKDK